MSAHAADGKVDYTDNGDSWKLENPFCNDGVLQSPIDLTTQIEIVGDNKNKAIINEKMEVIGYNYFNFPLTADDFKEFPTKIDPTWKVDFPKENAKGVKNRAELNITFWDGSKEYFTPLQFHMHAPSEHSVDGKLYDAELHLVHVYKVPDDTVIFGAVIGIFFDIEEGGAEPNTFLESLWGAIDTREQLDEALKT